MSRVTADAICLRLATMVTSALVAAAAVIVCHHVTLGYEPARHLIARRSILSKAAAAAATTAAATLGVPDVSMASPSSATPIADRLDATTLKLPPPSMGSELNGVDNFYYADWLEGEWDVTQTLNRAEPPLGLKYVGGPSGSEAIAAKSMEEQRQQIGVPVNLRLRWVKTKLGVAEDRLFNTKSRLDSFAGRSVVASVEYANVGGSNRASVLALGGSEDDPLQTTVVRFKGPAAQKVFVVGHAEEPGPDNKDTWAGREVLRSIFALTNQNTAPPVTTDTESIWHFVRVDAKTVKARLRITARMRGIRFWMSCQKQTG